MSGPVSQTRTNATKQRRVMWRDQHELRSEKYRLARRSDRRNVPSHKRFAVVSVAPSAASAEPSPEQKPRLKLALKPKLKLGLKIPKKKAA